MIDFTGIRSSSATVVSLLAATASWGPGVLAACSGLAAGVSLLTRFGERSRKWETLAIEWSRIASQLERLPDGQKLKFKKILDQINALQEQDTTPQDMKLSIVGTKVAWRRMYGEPHPNYP